MTEDTARANAYAARHERREIEAALRGDEDAYARLVDRHHDAMAGLMWRFAHNPADHEELVQEVFVQAYLGLSGFAGRGSFRSWLRTIATRTGYQYWKQCDKGRTHLSLSVAEIAEQADAVTDKTVSPSQAEMILRGLLEQLAPKNRLVLTLLYLEELRPEDIARQTGWTRPGVWMQAMRARRKLLRLVKKQGLEEALGWT